MRYNEARLPQVRLVTPFQLSVSPNDYASQYVHSTELNVQRSKKISMATGTETVSFDAIIQAGELYMATD